MTTASVPPARRVTGTALLVLAVGVLTGAGVAAGPAADAAERTAATEQTCGDQPERLETAAPPALTWLAADQAWATATGAGVVVAVVDSGVDVRNPHLADAVEKGTDVVGKSKDATGRTDTWSHGTAVAGIIAAREVQGSGVVGLAPDSTILPVRVYYGDDEQWNDAGLGPTAARMADGIRWAAEHGADVINVSMSASTDDPDLHAAVREATAAGALVVASAGNRQTADDTSDRPRYPAAYPEVLGVAAVGSDLQPSGESIHGEQVGVAAPGQQVLSVFPGEGDCWYAADAASSSWSTAYVSAAAALVAERFPDESPAQWAYRLQVTAARASAGERTDEVGWGVVRPDQALVFVDDGTAVGPPNPAATPTPAAAAPTPVQVAPAVDPLAPVRDAAVWWALAGAAVVTLTALAWRLVPRGPSRRVP
ncbi:S8 family serine peptidase [Cellulomonas sp. DKR-3]|uniref:S8 family serine peptidase n=1 Tax=Cellulomonas fulva TaxID=2835530 RepID=A0ABS5TYS7_9CELL|nr:S8 family serine peptidase [Cellulomonas fulva]MBT0994266.1 S8 family serine peptidase [Cellulomonas fulva]